MTVLAVGAYTLDLYMFGDHLPVTGESVGALDYATAHGGKAANVAVASARLGAPTRFVGCLGDDADRLAALAALRADGIEIGGCATADGTATGRSLVYVDNRGRQIVMTWPGAANLLHEGEPSALTEGMHDAHTRRAGSARGTVGGASPVGFLRPGTRGRIVIVTRGEHGAEITDDHGTVPIGVPCVNAVDTTGAGDAFVGALAAALRAGASLAQGARLACRVAAVSVTRRFCAPSYPSASELGIAPLQGPSGQEKPRGTTTSHPGSTGT